MTNWMARKAEQVKEQDRVEQQRRDWEIHRAALVRDKWAACWREIMSVMATDVDAFNQQFPTDEARHVRIANGGDHPIVIRQAATTRVLKISASERGVSLQLIVTEGVRRDVVELPGLEWNASSDGNVGIARSGGLLTSVESSERILKNLF